MIHVQGATGPEMIEFQVVKIAFRQVIDRLDLFHGGNGRQRLVVIELVEFGRRQ
jgi:hypothetical protein